MFLELIPQHGTAILFSDLGNLLSRADFYFKFNFQATKNTSQQFYFSTARVALLST